MRVIIYKSTNGFQYEVVNVFAEELAIGLRNRGCDVWVIDAIENEDYILKKTIGIVEKGLDLVLNFNGFLVDENSKLSIEYEMFKVLNIPVGILLVDHPFYHYNRINLCNDKNTFICMYSEGFLYSFEKFISNKKPIAQLMHGGTKVETKVKDKKYDIVMACTLKKTIDFREVLEEIPKGILKDLVINIYNEANQNSQLTLDEIFENELRKNKIGIKYVNSDEEFRRYLINMYCVIDKDLRFNKRYRILKRLLDEGFNVDLFGNCEIDDILNYKNLKIHKSVEYKSVLNEISQSKIIIHDLPYMINGSHERIFSSMINGTTVVCNNNNYCNGELRNNENVIFFDEDNLEDLIEKVNYIINNDESRKYIEGNAKIISYNNTWDNRAKEILDIYEKFKKINFN